MSDKVKEINPINIDTQGTNLRYRGAGMALRGIGKALKGNVSTIKSVKPTLGQSKTIEYKMKSLPKRASAMYQAERLKGTKGK